MTRVALVVLVLAGVAEASPVKPPPGWTTDPAAAVSLSKRLAEVPHFGGLATSPTTEVFRAPAGGSLFVTRMFAAAKPEERDRAVTIELDEINAAMRRAGSAATSELGDTRSIPDLKLLEGRRTWRDTTTNVVTTSRMIVAADAKQVVAVTGECVLAGDAPPDVAKACHAALASLDPEIPLEARVPLTQVATGVIPEPPVTPRSGPTLGANEVGPAARSAPLLGDGGERPALPPMTIPQEKPEPDRRPVYVGLGLIVLALLFWWNRKNRERLERAYEDRAAGSENKRDRDADDLHAAATGEGETGGTKEKTD